MDPNNARRELIGILEETCLYVQFLNGVGGPLEKRIVSAKAFLEAGGEVPADPVEEAEEIGFFLPRKERGQSWHSPCLCRAFRWKPSSNWGNKKLKVCTDCGRHEPHHYKGI